MSDLLLNNSHNKKIPHWDIFFPSGLGFLFFLETVAIQHLAKGCLQLLLAQFLIPGFSRRAPLVWHPVLVALAVVVKLAWCFLFPSFLAGHQLPTGLGLVKGCRCSFKSCSWILLRRWRWRTRCGSILVKLRPRRVWSTTTAAASS